MCRTVFICDCAPATSSSTGVGTVLSVLAAVVVLAFKGLWVLLDRVVVPLIVVVSVFGFRGARVVVRESTAAVQRRRAARRAAALTAAAARRPAPLALTAEPHGAVRWSAVLRESSPAPDGVAAARGASRY